MVDGREIAVRPTVGDMARAELESDEPLGQRMANGFEFSSGSLIAYHAARRTGKFTGSVDDWLSMLGNFVSEDDAATNGDGQ